MRVFVSGATGFIGRALCLRLQRDGHEVVAWVRDEARARGLLGPDVTLLSMEGSETALIDALDACDSVVNLAGAPIVGKRWTKSYQDELVKSRVALTTRLMAAAKAADSPPRVLVSTSAIGFYGNRGDAWLDEESSVGADFAADLCQRWEQAALRGAPEGCRVVVVRTGLVLGRSGGMLAKLLPIFKAGLGGPIGSGKAYMSWIHLADLVEMFVSSLSTETRSGIINGVSTAPVTNAEFTKVLAKVLGRPALFPVPAIALRAVYGAGADTIMSSQRVRPSWVEGSDFEYLFSDLEAALKDILETQNLEIVSIDESTPEPMSGGGYLQKRKPRYMLRTRTRLKVNLDNLWPFFSAASNLGLITPPDMGFRVTKPPEEMADGTVIEYKILVGGLPMSWRTQIECWRPGICFVDSQTAGPYRSWWHEHHFERDGDETVMEDRVYYNPPMGILGRIANWLFIRWELRRIFGYRADRIRFRFGG